MSGIGWLAVCLAALAAWATLSPPRPSPIVGAGRPPLRVTPVLVALLLATVLIAPSRHTLLAVILGLATWAGRGIWLRRGAARRAAATRARVLECCELLAAELAAGRSPAGALLVAAEEWPLLVPVAQCQEYGGDVAVALRQSAATPGAEDLALVAAAWQVAHRTGQGLALALTRLGESLRGGQATARVVQGELASARATARLVAVLPVVALAIGAGSGGDPVGFLLGTVPGLACLAVGLALGLSGLAWIERIAGEGHP